SSSPDQNSEKTEVAPEPVELKSVPTLEELMEEAMRVAGRDLKSVMPEVSSSTDPNGTKTEIAPEQLEPESIPAPKEELVLVGKSAPLPEASEVPSWVDRIFSVNVGREDSAQCAHVASQKGGEFARDVLLNLAFGETPDVRE